MGRKNCQIREEAAKAIARYVFEVLSKNPALGRRLLQEAKQSQVITHYKSDKTV